MTPDLVLVHEAQVYATGANVHKVNNYLQGYLSACELDFESTRDKFEGFLRTLIVEIKLSRSTYHN